MASPFLEIVELPSGEIVLRRNDSPSDPLVTIRFNAEARQFLGEYLRDVGHGMISAGMQIVSQLQSQSAQADAAAQHTVH